MGPFCETIFKGLLTGKEQHSSSQTEGRMGNNIIHVLLIDGDNTNFNRMENIRKKQTTT
jgi:hypothetical protein